MSKKRKLSKRTRKHTGGIGPVPAEIPPDAREHQRIEDVNELFTVDKNDPEQQKLASEWGWGRLYEIEKQEREDFERAKEL